MPKMKTHKGAKKRLRVTSKGKVKHKRANAGHLMSHKTGDRCRVMRKPKLLSGALAVKVLRVLGED